MLCGTMRERTPLSPSNDGGGATKSSLRSLRRHDVFFQHALLTRRQSIPGRPSLRVVRDELLEFLRQSIRGHANLERGCGPSIDFGTDA